MIHFLYFREREIRRGCGGAEPRRAWMGRTEGRPAACALVLSLFQADGAAAAADGRTSVLRALLGRRGCLGAAVTHMPLLE